MSAAASTRRLLASASAATYVLVFLAFLVFERPGLGIAHFFYISIALLALATGPRAGAAGGVIATALYVAGVALNPQIPPADVLTISTVIRFVTFVAMGVMIGWFARSNRSLVEDLRVLAERDSLTGLPNTRSFETAITRRLERGEPFALLLGDMDALKEINEQHGHAEGNDALLQLASVLAQSLRTDDEVARVGGDEFAVLASSQTVDETARLGARLEWVLAAEGCRITFGWALYPQEGANALSLYRVADERLYARKLVRGRRRGPGEPADDVEPPPAQPAIT